MNMARTVSFFLLTLITITLTGLPLTSATALAEVPNDIEKVSGEYNSPATNLLTSEHRVTYGASYAGVRRVSLAGVVLRGRIPSWAPRPVRGSITFNNDSNINATRRITARLDFRNADGSRWTSTTPITVLRLRSNERLCKITRAGHDVKYWLGFQAHCASSNACSYNIENNNIMWATIGSVEAILAQRGTRCP